MGRDKFNLPNDKMPIEYDPETMTRFAEDVYSKFNQISKDTGVGLETMLEMMRGVKQDVDHVAYVQENGPAGSNAVPPPPEGLECYKIPWLPIVVAWCKPINPIQYPDVGGFQFFASLVSNFTPLERSGIVTFTGCAASTHATNLVVCATESSKFFKAGTSTNLQFFASMSPGNSKTITNTTTGTDGTTVSWSSLTPKTLVTNIAWNAGDLYSFQTWMPKNLVGQGPLPFAVFFIDDWIGNPGWDKESVYVQARTYTKRRRSYSFFQTASTTGNTGETLDAPTVTATPIFWNGNIKITWTRGTGAKDWFDELDHYDLYRTTANDTADLDLAHIIWSGKGILNVYTDIGYDATDSPDGPEQGKTYWYWVVCVNKEGDNGTFSAPDSATLATGGTVTIYDNAEDETKSFFNVKNWNVFWYDDGESEGYWVRFRRKFGVGSYGIYSFPVYVRHTTEYGLHGSGYYIQKHTFNSLQVGQDYEFSVQATNNPLVPDLAGSWVTVDATITDSASPDAPT